MNPMIDAAAYENGQGEKISQVDVNAFEIHYSQQPDKCNNEIAIEDERYF